MAEEDKVRNTVFKEISTPPLPQLQLRFLARFKAESERQQAKTNLEKQHIFTIQGQSDNFWEGGQLSENKEKLKKLFLDSNKVVKENQASISRFYEIIREQRGHKVKLDNEILYTQLDIEEYKKVKETMEKYVKQYSIFENFLEDVAAVSKTGDLLSVGEILNRYETLEGTRADLTRILEAEMDTEAQLRQQMIDLLEDKSSTLKALGNHLVMLQVARRQALDCRTYWEMMVQRIKNMILARQEESVVLRGACWDLYNQVCSRRKVQPTLPIHDMESQLDYIQKSILFYKEVLTMATGSVTGGGRNLRSNSVVTINKKKL